MAGDEYTRRQAALKLMQKFADDGGFPLDYRKVDCGADIKLIASAPDGREFGVAYRKDGVPRTVAEALAELG